MVVKRNIRAGSHARTWSEIKQAQQIWGKRDHAEHSYVHREQEDRRARPSQFSQERPLWAIIGATAGELSKSASIDACERA